MLNAISRAAFFIFAQAPRLSFVNYGAMYARLVACCLEGIVDLSLAGVMPLRTSWFLLVTFSLTLGKVLGAPRTMLYLLN